MVLGLAHQLIRGHFGCRYRDVPKADLGLTAAEVFALSDKELNQVERPCDSCMAYIHIWGSA